MSNNNTRLYPEDQQKVDEYLKQGGNNAERKPFRPWALMAWLLAAIVTLGILSRMISNVILT